MRTIELLAPAGDRERLEMAVAYGADAVYLAGDEYGMRSFAGNFAGDTLEAAVAYAKARGVAVHVTCNTMPRGDEIARLPAFLERLEAAGVTAAIVADVGVLSLVKRYAPSVQIHVSTQASVVNAVSARAWHDLGARRVILARELGLDEIADIRAKTPADLELETFVHGAMCVSYSGRCLLSNYMTGRDANRGACAQPCRYRYALVEEKRPGEYFPIEEDGRGTYIMNARDMCMIDHLPDLIAAGVDSLKIEGRLRRHRHRGLSPVSRRRPRRAAARPGLARRGREGQPPALLHRLLLRPAGPVHRGRAVHPRLADPRGHRLLRRDRPGLGLPAQQVLRRGRGRAGRAGRAPGRLRRAGHDRRGRGPAPRAAPPADAVPDPAPAAGPAPQHPARLPGELVRRSAQKPGGPTRTGSWDRRLDNAAFCDMMETS